MPDGRPDRRRIAAASRRMIGRDRIRTIRSAPRLPESLTRFLSDPEAGIRPDPGRPPRPSRTGPTRRIAVATFSLALFVGVYGQVVQAW